MSVFLSAEPILTKSAQSAQTVLVPSRWIHLVPSIRRCPIHTLAFPVETWAMRDSCALTVLTVD